jgi:heterodisulfide reductase subunit A
MTLMELEEKIAKDDPAVVNSGSVVMVQCVGCRQKDRNYCSRVCCSHAIKEALALKKMNPAIDIYILYRDIRTYGFREDYYREAAGQGVRFIRYEPEDKPQVEAVEENGRSVLKVSVTEPILRKKMVLDADIIALAAAVIPAAGNAELSRLFKVPLSPDGFFQEAHVKLRPVDFAADGVFLCGTAHYPKHLQETIAQAHGAAGRAATILSRESVTASGAICEIDEAACVGCGQCQAFCNYGAIELNDTPQGKKARVISVLCKGCGLCNTKCTSKAISSQHFTDEQIMAEIHAALAAPAEVRTAER